MKVDKLSKTSDEYMDWEILLEKVNADLLKLGIDYSVNIQKVKNKFKNLYNVELNDGSNTYGLHEVGYGLTKILPNSNCIIILIS